MGEVDVTDRTAYQGNAVRIEYFPQQDVDYNEYLKKAPNYRIYALWN